MMPTSDYVFIMHCFDEDSRRRAEQLAGMLKVLNISTVFGENFCGQPVPDGVRCRLEAAKLSIALLTKTNKTDTNGWLPSQWVIQEVTWAVANKIPTLLLVEEGVKFDGGINGDLEKISFKNGDFAHALVRIASQAQTLMNGVLIPDDPPGTTSDTLENLILQARESGRRGDWGEVWELSEKALLIDPNSWRAMLNKGLALGKIGQIKPAGAIFFQMLELFDGNDQALACAYHNCGWIEETQNAGTLDKKSLRKQVKFYKKSLKLVPSRVYTRASLLLCEALLEKNDEANLLLKDSLDYRGFLNALHYEVENRGWEGFYALKMLPDWLYSILFPRWDTTYDGEEFEGIGLNGKKGEYYETSNIFENSNGNRNAARAGALGFR